jgi:hypothetical protein
VTDCALGGAYRGLMAQRSFIGERKQFFFEKKNQKTFIPMARAAGMVRDNDIKVFCFFSSEKKAFLRDMTEDQLHARDHDRLCVV